MFHVCTWRDCVKVQDRPPDARGSPCTVAPLHFVQCRQPQNILKASRPKSSTAHRPPPTLPRALHPNGPELTPLPPSPPEITRTHTYRDCTAVRRPSTRPCRPSEPTSFLKAGRTTLTRTVMGLQIRPSGPRQHRWQPAKSRA